MRWRRDNRAHWRPRCRPPHRDVLDAEIWIEQVKLDLRSPVDRARLAQGAAALGEMVRWVDVLSQDGPALAQFLPSVAGGRIEQGAAEVSAAVVWSACPTFPAWKMAPICWPCPDAEATLLARLNAGEVRS